MESNIAGLYDLDKVLGELPISESSRYIYMLIFAVLYVQYV